MTGGLQGHSWGFESIVPRPLGPLRFARTRMFARHQAGSGAQLRQGPAPAAPLSMPAGTCRGPPARRGGFQIHSSDRHWVTDHPQCLAFSFREGSQGPLSETQASDISLAPRPGLPNQTDHGFSD